MGYVSMAKKAGKAGMADYSDVTDKGYKRRLARYLVGY